MQTKKIRIKRDNYFRLREIVERLGAEDATGAALAQGIAAERLPLPRHRRRDAARDEEADGDGEVPTVVRAPVADAAASAAELTAERERPWSRIRRRMHGLRRRIGAMLGR